LATLTVLLPKVLPKIGGIISGDSAAYVPAEVGGALFPSE